MWASRAADNEAASRRSVRSCRHVYRHAPDLTVRRRALVPIVQTSSNGTNTCRRDDRPSRESSVTRSQSSSGRTCDTCHRRFLTMTRMPARTAGRFGIFSTGSKAFGAQKTDRSRTGREERSGIRRLGSNRSNPRQQPYRSKRVKCVASDATLPALVWGGPNERGGSG